MTCVTLHPGDNRLSLRRLIDQGVRVHSVVTDPPYGLVSVAKRFGKTNAKAARREGNDGSFARLSGGFMGKTWDGSGIERDPEFWRLVHDILLPGGYVFAFSGSRTGHWQACAMELAGFIMHPMHGWVFGSGFPKAHAADKAIDKLLGTPGEVVPQGRAVKRMIPGADQHTTGSWIKDNGREYQPGTYVPGSPEAAEWEGWAYGTQAQKPALEPIFLGQKPFDVKTGAANILRHGVGAVNIDGCLVASPEEDSKPRHPSNLLLDGSDGVTAMFPHTVSGGGPKPGTARSKVNTYGEPTVSMSEALGKNAGSAARFFSQFLPDADPLFYHPKAGKTCRAGSNHPTVKPIKLLRYLVRHVTPPGGTVLDPFAGSGTTAEAAKLEGMNCILMEAEPDYLAFLRRRFPDCATEDTSGDLLGEAMPETSTIGSYFEDVLG